MRCRSCKPIPEEVRRTADLLERRWTVSIIWASHEGALRFNEFSQSLGTIPPATLATRLVELEEAGILERLTVEGRPPRTEYRLTPPGRELRRLVTALRRVAGTYATGQWTTVLVLTTATSPAFTAASTSAFDVSNRGVTPSLNVTLFTCQSGE